MRDFWQNLDIEGHDIWVAFALLSRLPVPVDHHQAAKRGAKAAWAYPIVGAALGGIAAVIAGAAAGLGTPPAITAIIALAALILMTGGMHEDGLADTADGMGASSREKKLEIMHDSQIGTYGVLVLLLVTLGRWSGLADIATAVMTLAAIGAVSRAAMSFQMVILRNATEDGLSATTGQPTELTVLTGALIALVLCILATGFGAAALFLIPFLAILPITAYAKRALGGQTGDILGATQQVAELAAIATAVAILT